MAAGLSTKRADRAAAEAAVRDVYRTAGIAEPRIVIWMDSPSAGCLQPRRSASSGPARDQPARDQLGTSSGTSSRTSSGTSSGPALGPAQLWEPALGPAQGPALGPALEHSSGTRLGTQLWASLGPAWGWLGDQPGTTWASQTSLGPSLGQPGTSLAAWDQLGTALGTSSGSPGQPGGPAWASLHGPGIRGSEGPAGDHGLPTRRTNPSRPSMRSPRPLTARLVVAGTGPSFHRPPTVIARDGQGSLKSPPGRVGPWPWADGYAPHAWQWRPRPRVPRSPATAGKPPPSCGSPTRRSGGCAIERMGWDRFIPQQVSPRSAALYRPLGTPATSSPQYDVPERIYGDDADVRVPLCTNGTQERDGCVAASARPSLPTSLTLLHAAAWG